MSQENVELIKRIYQAWSDGATPEAVGALDPQIEIHPDPRSAWPGIEPVYHGYDGIGAYLASINAAFEGYRAEPERVFDAGDKVLVLAIERGRGKFSGAPVEIRHTAHIWTLRGGRAIRLDVNWDRVDALKAVGLEE